MKKIVVIIILVVSCMSCATQKCARSVVVTQDTIKWLPPTGEPQCRVIEIHGENTYRIDCVNCSHCAMW